MEMEGVKREGREKTDKRRRNQGRQEVENKEGRKGWNKNIVTQTISYPERGFIKP